jgi:ubiquinone/menaquinone biosynthesis C-methylase UbiE
MADELDAARIKAKRTYNAAGDHYDDEPLTFWDRYGRRTVERLALRPGVRVLDVCCGTGASALAAAEAVGPGGAVIAVDLAEELLERGRRKARARQHRNLQFRYGDMTTLEYPDHHFDAVVCVFGIFFVPDMEAQVAELWRMVRPGGQLAITTWGPRLFSPAYATWLDAVRRARADLHAAFNPWDRITTPAAVHGLLRAGGVTQIDVVAETGHQVLRTPEDFWVIALGSGLRWTIDQLGPTLADQVKREVVDWLATRKVGQVETNVVYAIGHRANDAA